MAGAALDFGLSYATQRPVLDDLLHFLPATLLLTGAALALILVTSPAVGHLGGAPSRSPAGLYRTADCLPRRLNAQLLAGLSAGDALFRASAVAPGDGVWRLAAPDIARRLHRLYVAGDQRPPAARQHAGRRQPASRDMGAAARIERAPVERRHILRNATLPVVTAMGMHIGELIGGTMIIENIFASARGRPLRSFRHFQSRLPGDPVLYPDDGDGVRAG